MGLTAGRAGAHIDMADQTFPALLVIRGDVVCVHPRANRGSQPVCPRRLQGAAAGLDNIMAMCTVKSCICAVHILSDRILRLIAIARNLIRAHDAVQDPGHTAQPG